MPAERLYDALLALGRPAPSRELSALERAREDLNWRDPAHRPAAERLLASGSRIAQEWVGLRHLTTSKDWHKDVQ